MRRLIAFSAMALTVGLVTLVIPSGNSEAANITPAYTENISQFALTVVGGDFDWDDTHSVVRGAYWKVDVNISEDAGWINDVLSINGTARHFIGPHAEGPNINIFNFNFTVDADKYPTGPSTAPPQNIAVAHVSHADDFTANLSFTTTTTGNIDDITGYTFTLTGKHIIPTGGTVELLGQFESAADASESSGRDYTAPIAAAAAAGVLALAAGGWYVRRRWLR
jgi:hypothetical protein